VRGLVGTDEDDGVGLLGTGVLDAELEERVRTLGLDSVSDASLGLVRERVTRPPAFEVEGSGDVIVCGFE